jgi:hypothetical protein
VSWSPVVAVVLGLTGVHSVCEPGYLLAKTEPFWTVGVLGSQP